MDTWLTVHVRLTDSATNSPSPVRIRFNAGGRSLAPFGRRSEFPSAPGVDVGGSVLIGGQQHHYIDGNCEISLPAGEVDVEVAKGPEFLPLRRTVVLGPGQISLRLNVERWTDLRRQGWFSGDTQVLYPDPHAALLEGAAEDLAIVNLLAHERGPECGQPLSLPHVLAFSGQKPALQRAECLVAVNSRNVHPVLGALNLLNCHRPIFPLRFGGTDGIEDWSLADWCDQCHRKKTGLVVWSDWHRDERNAETGPRTRSEALANLLLGRVDAFEVTRFDEAEPDCPADWYRLLNAGLRIPLVGGSGKDSNSQAVGAVRTYARLQERQDFDYPVWIEAVRAGRTFATNGPLVFLEVGGAGPGDVIRVEPGTTVSLRASAGSNVRIDRLELLVNGVVAASQEASGNPSSASVEMQWTAADSAWLAARCWSRERLPDGQCPFAQTSAAYVDVAGRPFEPRRSVVETLLADLDALAEWVRRQARCPLPQQRDHLEEVFSSARHALQERRTRDG